VIRWLPLALLLLQDPSVKLFPGEATSKTWKVTGTASVGDDTELIFGVRRIERRWEARLSRFIEYPDDHHRVRATADVKGRNFEVVLKAGPAGRYDITVSTHEQAIHKDRLPLGAVEALFQASVAGVKRISGFSEKIMACLDELERYADNPDQATMKAREVYGAKVTALQKQIEEEWGQVDFTGTLRLLRDACQHLRNAQIWETGPRPEGADNDKLGDRKGYFLDPNLTLGELRKALGSVREVLSTEMKVSIAGLLEGLYGLAGGTDGRRKESARAAARAASKLLDAAPVPNPDFAKLVDRAADSEVEIGPLRDQLRAAAEAHVAGP